MKSKVASTCNWRDKSLRKIAAPFSTPRSTTDCPAKSRLISTPISATRWAIFSRGIRTFNSAMAIHIKLKQLAIGTWHLASSRSCPRKANSECERPNYEPERHQTHLAGPRYLSHRDARGQDHHPGPLGHGQSPVPGGGEARQESRCPALHPRPLRPHRRCR